jgi:hypothetical protein
MRPNPTEDDRDVMLVRQKGFSRAPLFLEARRAGSISLGLPNRKGFAIPLNFE